MIKNVVSHIRGVEFYGVISILLFFTVFICLMVWAFRLKKSYLSSMQELPLNDEPSHETQVENSARV